MTCWKQRKEKSTYDNIKELATKWANQENVTVYLYPNQEGGFSFASLSDETFLSTAVEFISPLQ